MINLELSTEEIQVILKSIKHCLNSCHEGGTESGCPDCQKLKEIMLKIQAEVSENDG